MKLKTTPLAALAAFTIAGSASAAVLLNTGFEDDAVTVNSDTALVPASWTGYGSNGQYVVNGNALSGAGIAGANSGNQYFLAFANSTNLFSQIRQDSTLLWSSFTVGDSLTVSVYTTYRNDLTTGNVAFWLNDSDNAGLLSSGVIDVTDAAVGAWTLRTWTYTIDQTTLDAAAAGSWGAVEVGIGTVYNANTNEQVAFDDVSLVYTAIPEPGTALLGGLGMLALLRRRRA
jgi:hypothetical protein